MNLYYRQAVQHTLNNQNHLAYKLLIFIYSQKNEADVSTEKRGRPLPEIVTSSSQHGDCIWKGTQILLKELCEELPPLA